MTDSNQQKKAKFEPGDIVATPGALESLARVARLLDRRAETIGASLLTRHLTGDWGDVDEEDKALNDCALETGTRLISAYHIGDSQDPVKIWIITEADRSVTTLLLPSEY
jgi:hypothetical protein